MIPKTSCLLENQLLLIKVFQSQVLVDRMAARPLLLVVIRTDQGLILLGTGPTTSTKHEHILQKFASKMVLEKFVSFVRLFMTSFLSTVFLSLITNNRSKVESSQLMSVFKAIN